MSKLSLLLFTTIALFLIKCQTPEPIVEKSGFTKLNPDRTGIAFTNTITESDTLNYFTYPYIYMGGGVALVDLNNDDLLDIYFTGNMVSDKVYLNQGNMKFKDISAEAGLRKDDLWHTGVSVTDINEDGYMDLYVSVSGPGENRKNILLINDRNLGFSDQAEEYGVADSGNSIQSTFFDYDNDGDLDLYVVNYPITSFKTPNFKYRHLMNTVTVENSDRLYQNQGGGKFVDVTQEAGVLAFGLSISATMADFNDDGWLDIYVCNDFSTPDFFYINNQDGTFTEKVKEITKQTAFYSMGADAADFNNDGLVDYIQVDMSAEDNRRSKANMASMNIPLFWSTVSSGFHYQYMYNTLQLNRGINNRLPVMSNVAAFANVTSTDWSWAPLFADFDNDGWKDLFVTNGTRREINNKDYFNAIKGKLGDMSPQELLETSLNIPSEPIANYMYRNNQKLAFEKVSESWGLDDKGFSNGVAYGDLDNDGDLDLVINNIDSVSWVYQNQLSENKTNFLRVRLSGQSANPFGVGSKVEVYAGDLYQTSHVMLSRGFQSSVEPTLHFGLADLTSVDSVVVNWPGGQVSVRRGIEANTTIEVTNDKEVNNRKLELESGIFESVDSLINPVFKHQENSFDDYAFQILMPHKLSNLGPAIATGDLNGDQLDDLFVGGAADQAAMIYTQTPKGEFELTQILKEDAKYENIDATFFDADGDGDLDLYVVNGGNDFDSLSSNYQDQLYLNKNGVLVNEGLLPDMKASGGCVRPFDFDGDGDLDLFVGGRLSPRNYPFPGTSYFLVNRLESGQLFFEDQTQSLSSGLSHVGMVTDALWMDINNDRKVDLVVAGEWMEILWYENNGSSLLEPRPLSDKGKGWWFSLEKADIDNDGDEDLIAGNLGLNYKYKASESSPFDVFVKDFDLNGQDDIVLSYYNFGSQFPVRGRQCSSDQIPAIKTAYKDYNTFSTATVQEIFGTDALNSSLHHSISSFSSLYLENDGSGSFKAYDLPAEAQFSPINDIQVLDANNDGNLDLVIAGNLYGAEVETPRADASIGLIMIGDGSGQFEALSMNESGIYIPYDTKKLAGITIARKSGFVAANNSAPTQLFLKK